MPRRIIYLDNAATSWPKPEAVTHAVTRHLTHPTGSPGRGCHRLALEAEATLKQARLSVARLFGAQPTRLIFTLNCTDGINLALKGLLTPGDRVVISGLEHNAVTRPLRRLARSGEITLEIVRPDPRKSVVDPEAVRERLRAAATRLVVLTHASNVSGAIQPAAEIAALAHEFGALILLDAAQSAGHVPVQAGDGYDLIAVAGHKGLCGPAGTGALAVAPQVKLRTWREGGTGGDSLAPLQPAELPHALEAGTPNLPGIAGLAAGVDWIRNRGLEALHAQATRQVERLLAFLLDDARFTVAAPELGAAGRTGIVAFRLAGFAPETLGERLDAQYGIAGRSGVHCAPLAHESLGTLPLGLTRLSVGPFTTTAEIDAVIAALKGIVATPVR